MCGRYGVEKPMSRYAEMLGMKGLAAQPGDQIPNYDVRPGSFPRIVHRGQADEPSFVAYRWGFTPSWAKDPKGKHGPPINARSESLTTSPTWRHVANRRRCLVPADAWYEWLGEKSPKQRYCFRMGDHAPFFFGGVWDCWGKRGSEEEILSFAIVTRQAQENIGHIHDRMPVIVPAELAHDWLAEEPVVDLLHYLTGLQHGLDVFPVAQGASGAGLFVNCA